MKGFLKFARSNVNCFRVVFVVTTLACLLCTNFIVNARTIGPCMNPNYHSGDKILVSRIAYAGDKTPEREDVVVVKDPDGSGKTYIKRCIGLAGEVIDIKGGKLYINNKLYNQPYVPKAYKYDAVGFYVPKEGDEIEIIDDYYCIGKYIVGKKLANSELEKGRKDFLELYCRQKDGKYYIYQDCYFVMGDNVNNSYDSRFWDNRFVNEDIIVGKKILRYMKAIKVTEDIK